MVLLNPSLLRCYSVRPIFLGCCVLAVKVSREGEFSLSCQLSCVQDVFNLLDVRLLSRIEHQLLEVLSSQPAPIAPQPRTRISLSHTANAEEAPCPTALSGSFIAPVCANAVQEMDWRMPRDAGQYEIYAEALFLSLIHI